MVRGRKITGGKYHHFRKRKKFEIQSVERKVKLGKQKFKIIRELGGTKRKVLLSTDQANVFDSSTKKAKKSKIKNVIETPSNRFLARQNILIKSAIIETELGKARITNRPSQEGTVNCTLIKD